MKNIKFFGLGLCGMFFLNASGTLAGSSSYASARDLAATSPATMYTATADETKTSKKIKVALLLDTSNSMDGLIDQAKSQLWSIVNEMAEAKSGSMAPDLQIALYQYGNTGLPATQGFIQQVIPFTTNLDLISEKLFSLSTNGGDEYCGQVIHKSLNDLNWGDDRADYKTIFIAGNEPFDQGNLKPGVAFNLARQKDVTVNAIYCGDQASGFREGWNAAQLASIGGFMNINSDQKTVYITTPYDQRISELNTQLNGTYVYYGSEGLDNFNNMNTQDNNAAEYGTGNAVNRALMKNGRFYSNRNDNWDLVDKLNVDPNFDVKTVKAEQLPEELRKLSPAQREKYVMDKKNERASISREIAQLGELRTQHIEREKAKQGGDASLENAIITAIHQQAGAKGFTFGSEQSTGMADPEFVPSLVDFDYFLEVAHEVKEHRKDRLVDFNTFLAMSREPNTIILDTRSKEHYDAMHIAGAIHLNFSGFNVYDLARLIPDQDTRILIYCNNNVDTDNAEGFRGIQSQRQVEEIQRALVSKSGTPRRITNQDILKLPSGSYAGAALDPSKTMALNIPTFINLYGYGYRNVYELSQLIQPNDPRLVLEGTSITGGLRSSR